MAAVGFTGLTLTAQPVVQNTNTDAAPVWTVNPALTSGTVVAGILDPAGGINRMYNPTSVGFTPSNGDAVGKWLPAINSAGLVPTTVNDQYWASIPGQSGAANNKTGQLSLTLTAGTADTVRASSVMNFKLSPNAIVLTASGTFS